MAEEVIKSMLSKLDTMLEFDEGIDVDSVEELKSKYDTFVKENFQEVQTEIEITILNNQDYGCNR